MLQARIDCNQARRPFKLKTSLVCRGRTQTLLSGTDAKNLLHWILAKLRF